MKRRKTGRLMLGLNTSDWTITEGGDKGPVISIEAAKALWDNGLIGSYNLSFYRLVQCRWNMDEVKNYYTEIDKVRLESLARIRAQQGGIKNDA